MISLFRAHASSDQPIPHVGGTHRDRTLMPPTNPFVPHSLDRRKALAKEDSTPTPFRRAGLRCARRAIGLSGACLLIIVTLAACVSKPDLVAEKCVTVAAKENAMFREAVADALPSKEKILSITDLDGCDSAGAGAWLQVTISPEISEKTIRKGFLEKGWSTRVDKLKKCGDTCEASLAKRFGDRVVGMTLSGGRPEENSSGPPPWKIIVDDLDSCWPVEPDSCK
ncbi:hypothetical protein ACFY19_23490 [Streptosporangium saharense]|uniref:hypothetical protein n=1 Tax=Streptosporangium saharense TaxID=1706840 RepID=UPI0036B5E4BA